MTWMYHWKPWTIFYCKNFKIINQKKMSKLRFVAKTSFYAIHLKHTTIKLNLLLGIVLHKGHSRARFYDY